MHAENETNEKKILFEPTVFALRREQFNYIEFHLNRNT